MELTWPESPNTLFGVGQDFDGELEQLRSPPAAENRAVSATLHDDGSSAGTDNRSATRR